MWEMWAWNVTRGLFILLHSFFLLSEINVILPHSQRSLFSLTILLDSSLLSAPKEKTVFYSSFKPNVMQFPMAFLLYCSKDSSMYMDLLCSSSMAIGLSNPSLGYKFWFNADWLDFSIANNFLRHISMYRYVCICISISVWGIAVIGFSFFQFPMPFFSVSVIKILEFRDIERMYKHMNSWVCIWDFSGE